MKRIGPDTERKQLARRSAILGLIALACRARQSAAAAPGAPLIGAAIDLPPWIYLDASGHVSGILVDLYRELGLLSGTDIRVSAVPYPRVFVMMEHSDAALTLAFRHSAMDAIALPLAAIGGEQVILINRAGTDYRSIGDLNGKVVAQLRYADYLSDIVRDARLRRHDTVSYSQSLNLLLEGRVDAVVGLRTSLMYAQHSSRIDPKLLSTPIVLREGEYWLYLSRQHKDIALIDHLRAAAYALAKDRRLDALRMKHAYKLD